MSRIAALTEHAEGDWSRRVAPVGRLSLAVVHPSVVTEPRG